MPSTRLLAQSAASSSEGPTAIIVPVPGPSWQVAHPLTRNRAAPSAAAVSASDGRTSVVTSDDAAAGTATAA